jgi:hypothetical protein
MNPVKPMVTRTAEELVETGIEKGFFRTLRECGGRSFGIHPALAVLRAYTP